MESPIGGSEFKIPIADVSFINRKILDIPYAFASPAQSLDIYLPEHGQGPFPVLLVIHGGAFAIGDKQDTHLLPFLGALEHNFAVVSVNYRLSSEALFPAAVQDVKTAVRWIRANQKKYLLKGKWIAACGGSAGGNLAAMLGVTENIDDFDDPALGYMEFPSNVQAVVDWFGPINFLTMDEQLAINGRSFEDHRSPGSPESRYLGGPIFKYPDRARKANPSTYIHSKIPPFFIQHGSKDEMVPFQQSIEFAAEINRRAPGAIVQCEILINAGHGSPEFETQENMEKVFAFLKTHLIG
jgi:acetyl esterase/lipase